MALAVIPLALASWAVVRLASNSELDQADAHLRSVVSFSGAEFARRMADTRGGALRLAFAPPMRRALTEGDLDFLRAYARDHPTVRLRAGERTITGSYRGPAGSHTVRVGKQGAVTQLLPLDVQLLQRISPSERALDDERVVLLADGVVVAGTPRGARVDNGVFADPADIQLGDTEYRSFAQRLRETNPPAAVAALRTRSDIGGASDWWRALWAALATLLTLGLIAFLAAPLVAGRRWVRRLMPWELEEQYAVETDARPPLTAPVPSHGAEPAGNGGRAPATALAGRRRVVVIDDDPDERSLLADALGADVADVAATGDPELGLGLLGDRPADLAILDWQMPGRSAAEILAELNIRHPDVPVLVVADELEPQQRHIATLLGAEDFLIRPLEPEAVVAKAEPLLGPARADRRT